MQNYAQEHFLFLDELNLYELIILDCNENGFEVTISVKT